MPTSTQAGPTRTSNGRFELRYHESGDGPPLVMLHGSGPGVSGMSNFAANVPVFAASFRTIVPDMPGFGASPAIEWTRPYPEHAADAVLSLLDDLGIDRANVLGNSMGGWVALEAAAAAPERFDRLVLMGPGGLNADIFSPPGTEGARRLQEFVREPSRDAMRAWVDTMVSDPALITEELLDERMAGAMAPGAVDRMRAIFASLALPASKPPIWARAHEIPHPTLVTWGRDDRMLPLEGAFFGTRRLPRGDLHIFSHCGHWAQVERKDDFEALVTRFLTG